VRRNDERLADRAGSYKMFQNPTQLLMMSQAGFLDHEETVKGMQMFSREVYPRLKELPLY
jgi:hypothetical protein